MYHNSVFYDKVNKTYFKPGKTIRVTQLRPGDEVLATDTTTYAFTFKGFTGDEVQYGEGPIKFESVKEMYKAYGVRNARSLEELQDKNEYGYQSYLMGDAQLSGEDTAFEAPLYLYEGRWCSGSGADAVSFSEKIEMTPDEVHEYKMETDPEYRAWAQEQFFQAVKAEFTFLTFTEVLYKGLKFEIESTPYFKLDVAQFAERVREIAQDHGFSRVSVYEDRIRLLS